MTKEIEKGKENTEALEVENEMVSIIIRNEIANDNSDKENINEIKGFSDKNTIKLTNITSQ